MSSERVNSPDTTRPYLRRLGRRIVWWYQETDLPQWVLRPYCWARGYHVNQGTDYYWDACVWCRKVLYSAKRHGKQPWSRDRLAGRDRIWRNQPVPTRKGSQP